MKDIYPDNLVAFVQQLKNDGVSKDEYVKRIDFFLRKKAWHDGIPFSGQFELTPFCNLDCKMCYVHLNGNQMKGLSPLSVEQWNDLIDQAFCAGMRRATLTGGECLIYPGFEDVYLHLLSLGIQVTILSNGVELNQRRIDFFKLHPPAGIRISLYGSCDEVYKQVTGFAKFDTVWHNLLLIKESRLPLVISITPNRFMEADAEALIERVHSLGIPYIINSDLFSPREETGRKDSYIDASFDTYVRMHKKKRELEGTSCTPVDPVTLPDANKIGFPKYGITCGAAMNSFQISWNGEMYPCTNLRLFKANPLIEGFQTGWNRLHHEVMNIPLPSECQGCPYEVMCGPCVVMHIQNGCTSHCNIARCNRVRQYVAEGIYEFERDC